MKAMRDYPENVIEIHVSRCIPRELVTAEQVANQPRLQGWRMLSAWIGMGLFPAAAWGAIIWCALKGAGIP